METMEQKLVTIDPIIQARERLPSAIVHTPLLVSEELSNRLHKSVYLKCESLQITGHGTIGLEIMEDCPEAGLVLVPISSGGLIAGVAAAVKGRRPAARVIGVQPEGADAMARSLEAGHVVSIPEARTMCDALVATHPGELPFQHAQRDVEAVVRVSEAEIAHAVRFLAIE